jgi:hypothetical protein
MTSLKRLLMFGGMGFAVALASLAAAQTGPGQGSKMYDVKTETTVAGTVEGVETITGSGGKGRRGLGGTHLSVRTSAGPVEVHVGPTGYLAEQKIVLAKGDELEILGSRVTIDNESVLIARQIKKGDKTWVLRDATGRPAWSGKGKSER